MTRTFGPFVRTPRADSEEGQVVTRPVKKGDSMLFVGGKTLNGYHFLQELTNYHALFGIQKNWPRKNIILFE